MGLINDFFAYFGRVLRGFIRRAEENQPIEDFRDEDMDTLEQSLTEIDDNIGNVGKQQGITRRSLELARQRVQNVQQNLDNLMVLEAEETDPIKKAMVTRSVNSVSEQLVRYKNLVTGFEAILTQLEVTEQEAGIIQQDTFLKREEIDSRYAVAEAQESQAAILKISNDLRMQIVGVHTEAGKQSRKLRIDKIEERTAGRMGREEARQRQSSSLLTLAGKSILTKPQNVSAEARALQEEARQRQGISVKVEKTDQTSEGGK